MECLTRQCVWCLAVLLLVAGDDDCPKVTPTLATPSLKRKLFCNYDTEVRPVKDHRNVTEVRYDLYLKSLVYHDDVSSLDVYSLVYMRWRDELLTWDKNLYDGLDLMPVGCYRVWLPDIFMTEGRVDDSSVWRSPRHCTLERDGWITSVMPYLHTAICIPDVTRWPFDTTNCTMVISSMVHSVDQINLIFSDNGVSLKTYKENAHWALSRADAVSDDSVLLSGVHFWPSIEYRFVLQRHSGCYTATVFVPAVVLAMMTLVTFWLDPGDSERMSLIQVNVICHCMYMIYLGVKVPETGVTTPHIMTFFRDSFLLVGVSLLVSLCAGRMNTAARAPPTWVSSITDCMVASRVGQLLLLGGLNPKSCTVFSGSGRADDDAALVEACYASEGWRLFATLIDRICFFTFSISLIILLCAFIPQA